MLITHALAELYNCLPKIEDEAFLASAARAGAQIVGATVIEEYEVRYLPHGLTLVLFLAESHIVLSTWPEHRLVLLDVLMCNPTMDYNLVVAQIKEHICPSGRIIVHEVYRKIANVPDDRDGEMT